MQALGNESGFSNRDLPAVPAKEYRECLIVAGSHEAMARQQDNGEANSLPSELLGISAVSTTGATKTPTSVRQSRTIGV